MKPTSAKAKGRSFQKEVVALLLNNFNDLQEGDLISRSSGSNGEDIILSPRAKEILGELSIECKHRATGLKLVYDSLSQALGQKKGLPIAFLRNNRKPAIVAMLAEDFFQYIKTCVEK